MEGSEAQGEWEGLPNVKHGDWKDSDSNAEIINMREEQFGVSFNLCLIHLFENETTIHFDYLYKEL